jgi:hypothetical protein
MLDTYVVEGGIGKCIAFTALVPKLAEKAGQPIQIHTPYVDCFANNTLVEMAYESASIPLGDPRIIRSDNIYYCEPYKTNFVFGKQHLIEAYCLQHGVEYDSSMRPKLYTDHLKERAAQFLEKAGISGKYMMVQFTGGQSPFNFGPNVQYQSHMPLRNYPYFLAQQVIDKLKAAYPTVSIIDFSLPNEPRYQGTVQFEEHWATGHELLKNAEGFISIDSMLQHMSASTGTKGVVLWGQSRWTQFGYDHNTNLSFHQGKVWDESKFNEPDPRNVCVDPDEVVTAYRALFTKGGKKAA